MIASLIVSLLTAAAPAAPTAATNAKRDPNRVICRTEEVTGSHLNTERKCMTAQQWAEQQRVQRESLQRSQVR